MYVELRHGVIVEVIDKSNVGSIDLIAGIQAFFLVISGYIFLR
jgi:hypothetical protein